MAKVHDEVTTVSTSCIHDVPCAGCRSPRIFSDRYKCLKCSHYDLCGYCFEERRETLSHSSGHPMLHFKIPNELFGQPVPHSNHITLMDLDEFLVDSQHNTQCDGCWTPITGIRFKCDTCLSYNLCLPCTKQQTTSKSHQNTHPLLLTSNRNLLKIDVNDIKRGEVLGHGTFGQVYKAVWLSKSREVACKVIRVTPERRHLEESFHKELDAYAELSGAFILKTFGYGELITTNNVKECFLITEFMHRGSLSNVIHNTTEKISFRRKLFLACDIACGMQKLHAHSMIHCDIRPDNILVSRDYTAKIGDMGIAHVFNPDRKHTLMGCLSFMPPEFHRGDDQCDQSLDVFTFGLTLNELFTEKPHRFIQATKRVQLIQTSCVFADLINQSISEEAAKRPTAVELDDILNKYRRAADKYLRDNHPDYSNQTTDSKNAIFVNFHDEYSKLHKEEPKQVYLSPPKPHLDSDLFRQHFDDMMKQLRSMRHHFDFLQTKHQDESSSNTNAFRYFDDELINRDESFFKSKSKLDKKILHRSSCFSSSRLRIPEVNQQQPHYIMKLEWSCIPTLFAARLKHRLLEHQHLHHLDASQSFPSNINTIQLLDGFHFSDDFNHVSPRIVHLMRYLK